MFQIDIPALRLSSGILKRKRKDGTALLNRVFALRIIRGEGSRNSVESSGGGKGIWPIFLLAGYLVIADTQREGLREGELG